MKEGGQTLNYKGLTPFGFVKRAFCKNWKVDGLKNI